MTEGASAQMERILASGLFRDAPSQQRLLRYLVDSALENGGRELKEYSIGQGVFQRGAGFDPRTDSIVRVQVGVLRRKLAAYYQTVGAEDPVVIEVPRGQYCPRFAAKEPAKTVPVPPAEPSRKWRFALAGAMIGAAAVAFLMPWLGAPPPARHVTMAEEWSRHPLWRGFFAADSHTKLVVGAPMMFRLSEGLLVRDVTLNSPGEAHSGAPIEQLERTLGRRATTIELYTGLGEAAGISFLDHFFASADRQLPLVRNRLSRWQDLTAGNVIFLASLRFHTLNEELHLASDFAAVGGLAGERLAIGNPHAAAGEQPVYSPAMNDSLTGFDYALVTVLPGTQPGRRIMALGGTNTWGTEGVAQFVTDPAILRDLAPRVGVSPKRGLQVLVKVTIREGQVVSATYVTHHWLET